MTIPIIHQREWTFRRIVAELPFIPATSNWLKLLCSLLAETLMFVSSLCIIADCLRFYSEERYIDIRSLF